MKTLSLPRLSTAPLVVALCCFAAAWVADVWWSTHRQISEGQARALVSATRDAASFARVFEEHTARTIQSADQAVQFLKNEFREKGTRLSLRQLIDDGVILDDIFNLYTVVGADGEILLSSQPFKPINLADRAHFAVHREHPETGLFVSKPVLGRVSRKWSIQLTRRIEAPGGGFGGVIVVSMDPYYFTRLYESAQIGAHSVVTLIGEDGIVRARRTGSASEIGQDITKSELFRNLGAKQAGTTRFNSLIDGRERVYAFRRLKGYPLLVVVGIDVADVIGALSGVQTQLFKQAVMSTVAIVLFTGILLLLTRRLLRSHAQAIAANAAKTQFLSNMSHELRTPLNGILGYAELLTFELEQPEQREYADIIHTSGQHLLSLVNQLLQLSKIESGNDSAELAEEQVRIVLARVVDAHRSSAALKGLKLDLAIAPQVPAMIVCDRMKLVQVLNNLLHNAIKFTDAGRIDVALAPRGPDLVFSVRDTGRGIPADVHEKIFEKFFQVDAGDARIGAGTGMGLSLVRELVRLMGGQLTLESAPGAGSTLAFSIPQAARVPAAHPVQEMA
ncbi:sensor histidine kinase [Massilia sp. DWR3-1-1]|uniref:sensor histidine kinase n=1 Tax=Massilia sp. DWR3-1-1 TaxID=2804559 RepID=UPI003CE8FBD8